MVSAALAPTHGQTSAPRQPVTFRQPVFVMAPGHRVMMHELLRASDVDATIDPGAPEKLPDIAQFGTLLIVPDFDIRRLAKGSSDANGPEVSRLRLLTTQARKADVPTLVLSLTARETRHAGSRIAADAADLIVTVEDAAPEPYYRSKASARGIPLDATAGISEAGATVLSLVGASPLVAHGAVGDAPALKTSQTPDGAAFDLSSLRGRWVVLYFWQAHQRYLVDSMVQSQRQYGAHAQLVSVAVESTAGTWRDTIKSLPAGWVHLRSDAAGDDFARRLGIVTAPAALLIDGDGKVVVRSVCGFGDVYRQLETQFGPAVASPPSLLRYLPSGPC